MKDTISALAVASIVLVLSFSPVAAQEQVTETQKVHSHLFPEYKSGRNIRELASRGSGNVVVLKPVIPIAMGGGGVNVRSPSGNAYLDYMSSRADAVVIGTLKNKSSQLTDDGSFFLQIMSWLLIPLRSLHPSPQTAKLLLLGQAERSY